MKIKNIILTLMMLLFLAVSVTAQIFPTSFSVSSGTLTSGNLTCLEEIGLSCIIVTEQSQAPGFTINFNYTNITTIETLNLVYYKEGAGVHTVDYEIYDYMFDLWFDVDQFVLVPTSIETVTGYPQPSSRFIENGLVQTRLLHEDAGNPSNSIDIYSVFIEPVTGDSGETCPVTDVQSRNNLILLIFIGGIIALGFASPVIGMVGGIGAIVYSLSIISCNRNIAILGIVVGVLLMWYFATKET